MTTVEGTPVHTGGLAGAVPATGSDPLASCLDAALQAADAADVLGLESRPLRDVHGAGLRRVGFPGDAYVLALVGGTGVGKSSLLNALAGRVVSTASARGATTAGAGAPRRPGGRPRRNRWPGGGPTRPRRFGPSWIGSASTSPGSMGRRT